jgi:hypothetical protein
MKYVDVINGTIQPLVNNHRIIQPLNGRMLLANFQPSSTTPAPSSTTPAPTDAGTSASTGAGAPSTIATVASTTDGASRISENHFMFFASLFLVLFSFLEI